MRVLIVNTSEKTGGAAVAAHRLMDALNNHGVKAKMLVRDKESDNISVAKVPDGLCMKWHFLWERWVIFCNNLFSRKHLFDVDIANSGYDITRTREFREADIIHLHWTNQGFLSLKGLEKIFRSGKPVVWTMHDMWACTSICHHAHGCDHFHASCGDCRFLRFPKTNDLSHKVHLQKQRIMKDAPLQVVAVSSWLAQQASCSSLLRDKPITVIPNTLSLERFHLSDRSDMRSLLHISSKYVVLFGAARIDAPIKGLDYLLQSLRHLISNMGYKAEDLHLLLFGGVKDIACLASIPVPYTCMGLVNDEDTLSQLYSAADVLVSSSLYETFGQTIIEAQACGCLPVAFNNSGPSDIITHQKNGYLAEYLSVESLAQGIDWAFHAAVERRELRRGVFARYSESKIANSYITLYEQLLSKS